MSTITAKRLNEALAKAKNIGLVEETFILDDCEVTLRNLRPEEYVAVLQACQGLDDVAYLHAYQAEHIARSIVAINGMDLHDTKYVMDEEPDPKELEKLRPIKLELPTYLLKNVVSTWSKEAVYTAYRKFTDVVEKAERKAKEGVTFLLPEETDEEKYRRLLLEAKGCEENLPSSLVDHILDDLGYMRKSTAEEIKAAMEKTDQLAREEEAKKASEPIIEFQSTPTSELVTVSHLKEGEIPLSEQNKTTPEIRQAQRQPLNQFPGKPPIDPHATLQKAIEARQKAFTPMQAAPSVPQETNSKTPSRAAKIAALETDAGMAGVGLSLPQKEGDLIPIYQAPGTEKEVVELRKQEPIDPKQVVIDQPPKSGINPRFQPPTKI